ncbi:hypothetical protein SCOR_21085 [Sulfidibacter corallicola]|uniref:Uncharacterized protein n=1 Tax=Sulfidibacter corallicola TaxID=2818388 RepID=A0A8A4TV86_SULCO|nr:hypothetical protein [Sulfidibacter corallicola]QTD53068.1 hypothetical protein J3U87_11455 [Sulfidibacter corallicola]
MLLAPDDSEELFYQIMRYWSRHGDPNSFPTLITPQPGPIRMRSGLRLLASEFPPNWSLPDILVISTLGDWALDLKVEALIRRCLARNRAVLVVGERFPEDFQNMSLEPGHRLALVDPGELFSELKKADAAWRSETAGGDAKSGE